VTSLTLDGTPRKRHRRTKAELAVLQDQLCDIIAEHQPCTVRQVFYLSVVDGLCDKSDRGYQLIQREVLKLRRFGVVPYGWIADNVRTYYGRTRYRDLEEFGVAASRYLYHFDYWRDAPVNVELWVESDSIAGTLRETVIDDWGLRLHVARGFSSETFLFNSGAELEEDGRPAQVYVLSDFDPSGVSLAEDIGRKLVQFAGSVRVNVQRIALSGYQVRAWGLPTHPLKASDRRAARFRLEHGAEACELEAIPPTMLRSLVSDAIGRHIDPARIEAAKRDEQLQRDALRQLPDFLRGAA
jgi:hypothetical protein